MNQIIAFPRGQLSDDDRARMEAVGIVVVEADDPSRVVTIIPGAPVATPDDLAMAALAAIAKCPIDSTAALFTKTLHARLAAREAKANPEGRSDG